MHPLHDNRRRILFYFAAVLCAIPLCLIPLAGRSAREVRESRVLQARFAPRNADDGGRGSVVAVAHDPFVADRPVIRVSSSTGSVVGMRVVQGQPVGTFGVPSVSAIATGASPRALVAEAGHVRVVAIGDTVAGSRVRSIDAKGVRLQKGTLLPLAQERP